MCMRRAPSTTWIESLHWLHAFAFVDKRIYGRCYEMNPANTIPLHAL